MIPAARGRCNPGPPRAAGLKLSVGKMPDRRDIVGAQDMDDGDRARLPALRGARVPARKQYRFALAARGSCQMGRFLAVGALP